MKIAIPSDDQVHIAGHFGRTRGFLIYDVNGNKINEKVYVENNFTRHVQGHNPNKSFQH